VEVSGIRNGQTYTDSASFTNAPPPPPLQHIAALTGTPYARINFQPAGTPAFAGYDQDNGLVFATRANGQSYGWNIDNTANTRDRNSASSADQRYDTLIHMQH